ncbi:MAG TPA: hypothetical protein PK340_02525 [Bacilli bacterium]|nr:hypothetical protein [Bacilli bacterium]
MKKMSMLVAICGMVLLFGISTKPAIDATIKVDAAVVTEPTKRVHFFGNTSSSVWGASGEVMKINYTTDDIPTTSEMVLDLTSAGSSTTTFMWYFDLPNDVTQFTFSKYNSSDELLATSSSITYSATSIMFMVNSSNEPIAKTDKPSAHLHSSPTTMRIWITNYFANWYGSQGYPLTLRVDDNTHYYLNYFSIDDSRSASYYYADIPVSSGYWQVYSLNIPTDLGTKGSTTGISSNHYKLYALPTSTKGSAPVVDAAPTNIRTDAFAKVLEGYTTCTDSTLNGYGAWANLETYWYNNLESTDLSSLTLIDHEQTDIEDGNYKSDVIKTSSVPVQDKWDMMEYLYNAIPEGPEVGFVNQNYSKSTLEMIVFGFATMAAFAALYLKIRQRRTN